ncbi:MAG: VacJ family lipoprotein [Gammaproteobacteria bacterium]|jgi:phospholipid-binding lipoprotein MlaA|nr:VacJ family lipoprotein [Gammaproteobacteria bacterium]
MQRHATGCIAALLALLSAAASAQMPDIYDEDFEYEETLLIADPLEPFNRAMFAFNDKVYFYVLKPVVRVYRHVPEPARVSVGNFFSNLRAPIRMANSLLQLKLVDAGNELLRFGVNSTVGIGGLFDPAGRYLGIRRVDEDLGQTLGHYGVGQGFYIVAPFLGPTTLRDGAGNFVDAWYLDPVMYVEDDGVATGLFALDKVNAVSIDRDTYEEITREAFDPYTFIRDAYVQRRSAAVAR